MFIQAYELREASKGSTLIALLQSLHLIRTRFLLEKYIRAGKNVLARRDPSTADFILTSSFRSNGAIFNA
jgi:hypothetical protein